MKIYKVTFERIGRDRDVSTLWVKAKNDAELMASLRCYARDKIMSRDFDVVLGDDGKGYFAAGFHNAGEFTVEQEFP